MDDFTYELECIVQNYVFVSYEVNKLHWSFQYLFSHSLISLYSLTTDDKNLNRDSRFKISGEI